MDPALLIFVLAFFIWYRFIYSDKKDDPSNKIQPPEKNNDNQNKVKTIVSIKRKNTSVDKVDKAPSKIDRVSLEKLILEEINKSSNGLKATTIANRISKNKSVKRIKREEVNSILYGKNFQDKVYRDDSFKWYLLKNKFSIEELILKELSKDDVGLKAITLANRISKIQRTKVLRKDVNSILYGKRLQSRVYKDDLHKWFLKKPKTSDFSPDSSKNNIQEKKTDSVNILNDIILRLNSGEKISSHPNYSFYRSKFRNYKNLSEIEKILMDQIRQMIDNK